MAQMSVLPEELLPNMFSKTAMDRRKKNWDKFIQYLEIKGNIHENELGKTPAEFVEEIEKLTAQYLQEIKQILFKRNESRILQDGKFKDWSKKLFIAVLKVRGHVPLEDVKKHNRQVLKGNLTEIHKKMQKYKSPLRRMLLLREANESNPDSNLNLEIKKEWERLLKVMSLENLVIYSLDVLKGIRDQKRQTGVLSPSQRSKQLKDKPLLRVVEQTGKNERPNKVISSCSGQYIRKKDKLRVVKQKERFNQSPNKGGIRSAKWIVEEIGKMERLNKSPVEVEARRTPEKKKLRIIEEEEKNDKRLKQSRKTINAQSNKKKNKLIVDQKETEFKPSQIDFRHQETQHFRCGRSKKRLIVDANK